MIKHILKMIWNRKRANALIITEVLLSFLVLFGVCSSYLYYAYLYRQPLGFEFENIWAIRISFGKPWEDEMSGTLTQLRNVIAELEEVEQVEALHIPPFIGWTWSSTNRVKDRKTPSYYNRASDGLPDMLGIRILEGQWFGPEHDGLHWDPVVINRRQAQTFFGDESPLGKNVQENDQDEEERRERRVVGVIDDFRQHGEFRQLSNYTFMRHAWSETSESAVRSISIKVRPGTPATFEEKLSKSLERVAKTWTFTITPWSQLRQELHREKMTPLIAVGIVSGFLMLMVAFGLLGVLWQNVTQRTQEIGLRRAMGSNRKRVMRQISGELVMVASFGIGIGLVLAFQFPLFGLFVHVGYWVYVLGALTAALLMYLITLLCSLYPSWLAAKITPAQALHYE